MILLQWFDWRTARFVDPMHVENGTQLRRQWRPRVQRSNFRCLVPPRRARVQLVFGGHQEAARVATMFLSVPRVAPAAKAAARAAAAIRPAISSRASQQHNTDSVPKRGKPGAPAAGFTNLRVASLLCIFALPAPLPVMPRCPPPPPHNSIIERKSGASCLRA